MKTKTVLVIINIIALIATLIWLMVNPGWEPVVALLVAIGALVAQIKVSSEKGSIQMSIKAGKGSKNIQSGRDITINKC